MTIVAGHYAHVVGVDTRDRTHAYAVLSSATGQVADTATFPTSPPGIGRAMSWISRRTTGGAVLVSIEGASSCGAGLTHAVMKACIDACDVRPPRRGSRTGKGKSDAIDAVAAARTVLGCDLESLLQPRADGGRNALHILVNARRSMDTQRSADRHALTALARTMDLGIDARKPPTDAQVLAISRWRPRTLDVRAARVTRAEARRLATAIIHFTAGTDENQGELAEAVEDMAPGLLDVYGVGPVTAAIILTAYSHHGRVRSEAAFAALAA